MLRACCTPHSYVALSTLPLSTPAAAAAAAAAAAFKPLAAPCGRCSGRHTALFLGTNYLPLEATKTSNDEPTNLSNQPKPPDHQPTDPSTKPVALTASLNYYLGHSMEIGEKIDIRVLSVVDQFFRKKTRLIFSRQFDMGTGTVGVRVS